MRGVSVRTKVTDSVGGVCHSMGWAEPDEAVVVLSVLLAVGLVASFKHVAKARSLLEEERELTAAERDAFSEFKKEISAIETTQSIRKPVTIVAVTGESTNQQLQRVRAAYRETVMAVPHYETEYDEPIEVNMSAELGEEVTAAVFDGTGFTQQIKRGLLSQATEAHRQRSELLAALRREERQLTEARDELCGIETALEAEKPEPVHQCPFSELSDRWERLGNIEERCRDLLESHAATRGKPIEERPQFREYVYQSLTTEYPVLSDGTRLLDRITDCRQTVMRELTRRG